MANQRQEWVFRLKEEYKASIFSIFVTLTYDDAHLPADQSVNKADVVKFHKRLRKHFPPGDMRYYVVSEYGDHTFRPHYHGLYFFQHFYDMDFIYNTFFESWKNGFIKFGNVEEGSIVYCTKYCLKHKILPEGKKSTFRLISKMNGGIGISYLQKMSDYHVQTENFQFVAADGKKCRMPRYYRDAINPYRGASKYNPLHTRKEDRICQDRLETARKRFAEFCRSRSGTAISDVEKAFNERELQIRENRDELLIKHCKKQKL